MGVINLGNGLARVITGPGIQVIQNPTAADVEKLIQQAKTMAANSGGSVTVQSGSICVTNIPPQASQNQTTMTTTAPSSGLPKAVSPTPLSVPNPIIPKKKYEYMVADLDGTLIDTISGNVFPKGVFDMRFKYDVLDAIKKYGPKVLFVVSNQAGISKGFVKEDSFKAKLDYVTMSLRDYLGINVYSDYCTAEDNNDPRRKPNTGMVDDLVTAHIPFSLSKFKEKCLMIGDASGKEANETPDGKKQFSDSDKKCAENFGVDYMDVWDFIESADTATVLVEHDFLRNSKKKKKFGIVRLTWDGSHQDLIDDCKKTIENVPGNIYYVTEYNNYWDKNLQNNSPYHTNSEWLSKTLDKVGITASYRVFRSTPDVDTIVFIPDTLITKLLDEAEVYVSRPVNNFLGSIKR